uniref:Polysaccharide pyruvyl transferase domain-containing protein n=1 Tax=Desulfovibrio sp. U5L TaxID=596152 RepID=I2Q7L6_9BACT
MYISLFDTTIADNNLGNSIIMEAVDRYLDALFPEAFRIRLPYLDSIGQVSGGYIRQSDHVFFGGTNALSSDMSLYRQWGVDTGNLDAVRDVVLMGVGWWQYQPDPTQETAAILRRVLHSRAWHAVRDSYTASKLQSAGIENVLVTGCPTLWGLTPERCSAIPRNKAPAVLAALTDYNRRPDLDKPLMEMLSHHYERVFVWEQGPGDCDYARMLCPRAETVPPRLDALDALLASPLKLDYVGTRLHAGIRAMQFGRRSIILGIDNRALEKAQDFNLPVVPREDLNRLEVTINGPLETRLRLPWKAIRTWLGQFPEARPTDPTRMPPHGCRACLPSHENPLRSTRTAPISRVFGFDRGTPVDRYYIEIFLTGEARNIRGRVLEVGDAEYTGRLGTGVLRCDVLHACSGNGASIVGDLVTGENIPIGAFDCLVLTQTLNVLADPGAALATAFAALAPGGTLLVTTPGISQVSRYDMDRWGDFWRFTERSLALIANRAGAWAHLEIQSFGNVYAAKAFLDGLAAEELDRQALLRHDPDYPVLLGLAAVKPGGLSNGDRMVGSDSALQLR